MTFVQKNIREGRAIQNLARTTDLIFRTHVTPDYLHSEWDANRGFYSINTPFGHKSAQTTDSTYRLSTPFESMAGRHHISDPMLFMFFVHQWQLPLQLLQFFSTSTTLNPSITRNVNLQSRHSLKTSKNHNPTT